jgi:nucleoporin NDC1
MTSAGPSAPMRALPSNLALRAAPTVPSAPQTYEPLVKTVLRQRLLRMFLYSAAFCWAMVALASTFRQGGMRGLGLVGVLFNPFQPRTLALAGTTWLFGVVPVLVFRKAYLTGMFYVSCYFPLFVINTSLVKAIPTSAASPSQVFHAALSKASTIRSLVAYVASASLLTLVHVLTALIFEVKAGNDPHLSLFVKSKCVVIPQGSVPRRANAF